MGKYLNKSKIAGDVSHPITRAAKNLALQRLRSDSTSPSDDADSFRYLQLRNRRLVKLPLLPDTKKQLIHSVAESRTRNPRAKKSVSALVIETEEDCGSNCCN
ncbi:hypothetical protein AALP_AA3G289100 [Arabis alpina]|uniref:Uncharacterized protein n=1 Tax=Arabis alpina TaxID=50452 RepID=A0A087HCE2_ARAAL|nr:hypothetical protein AALP_AA3G289100 [Arabis alpina]